MPGVKRERDDSVGVLTLDEPATLNAMTPDLLGDLAIAIGEMTDDPQVRALVLTGAGRGFCSGQNLKAAQILGDDIAAGVMKYYWPTFKALRECRVPVVVAVNGVAAGGGFSLAMAGDMIVAARSARDSRTVMLPAFKGGVRAVAFVPRQDPWDLLEEIRMQARRRQFPLIAGTRTGSVLAVCADDDETLARLTSPDRVRHVVLGPAVPTIERVSLSMDEVLAALRALPAFRGQRCVITTTDLILERALIGDEAALDVLVSDCIEPLIVAGGDLLETVERLIAVDGRIEAVARAMPAHVNTVRYRIGRIQQITGRDFRRTRDAVQFSLALHRYRMREAECSWRHP